MMVDEKYFPRYDVHEFGLLLTETMTKALEMMKKFGIKHATYWALPTAPRDAQGYLMRIDVPLDEFLPLTYSGIAVDVEPDCNDVKAFRLTLDIVENQVKLVAETDIGNLLANRVLLDALSSGNLLKLVNALENWINNHVQYIETKYQGKLEILKWFLAEPDFLQKKQLYHKIHQEMMKKTDAKP